jgi:hypothetical protein
VRGGFRRQVDGTADLPSAPEMPYAPSEFMLGAMSRRSPRLPQAPCNRLIAAIRGSWSTLGHVRVDGVIADASTEDGLPFLGLALTGERRHVSTASP